MNAPASFSYPNSKTVKGRVLGALLRGKRVTHIYCRQRLGLNNTRLSHHIFCLRRLAWPIKTFKARIPTSDAGRVATLGLYYLDHEAFTSAGELGHRYAEECARGEVERRAA